MPVLFAVVFRTELRTWLVLREKSLMPMQKVVSVGFSLPSKSSFCIYKVAILAPLNFLVHLFSGGKKKEVKKETGLGLSYKKEENFGEWYSEVIPM